MVLGSKKASSNCFISPKPVVLGPKVRVIAVAVQIGHHIHGVADAQQSRNGLLIPQSIHQVYGHIATSLPRARGKGACGSSMPHRTRGRRILPHLVPALVRKNFVVLRLVEKVMLGVLG